MGSSERERPSVILRMVQLTLRLRWPKGVLDIWKGGIGEEYSDEVLT